MPGFAGHPTRTSPSAGHNPGATNSRNERTIRRHVKDLSLTSATSIGDVSLSGCSTSLGPDIDKDLPRIPSTSTALWDTDQMTVLSEMMVSPVISPAPNYPPLPFYQSFRRIAITEAQDTTAQSICYGSLEILQNEVPCPPMLEVSTYLISDTLLAPPRTPWMASHPSEADNLGSRAGRFVTTSDIISFAGSLFRP